MATINQTMRDHQLEANWEYNDVCVLFWYYYDILRERYYPDLPDCLFGCEPMNKKSKLRYQMGDNRHGVEFEVTFNAKWLSISRCAFATFVMHTMIHIWLECHDKHSTCGGHNEEFISIAQDRGIPACAGRVCKVIAPSNEFKMLISKFDPDYLNPVRADSVPPAPSPPRSERIEFFCMCTSYVALPGASFRCNHCGEEATPKE